MIDLSCYRGRRVLVTGSEGFKGQHLADRLVALGAAAMHLDVTLDDGNQPYQNVNRREFRGIVASAKPDAVFHLAAQAFVPVGFQEPLVTWATNLGGTVNLLDSLREYNRPCAVVIVTTDKVYGDTGGALAAESAPFAPQCPYSASKVAVELAVESYRSAFFAPGGHRIAVATARAGNVIGGGDFGEGRLVPNAILALTNGKRIPIYHPSAVRPWQYIDDVIEGYLLLGAALWAVTEDPELHRADRFCSPWNFGPSVHHTVLDVANEVVRAWGSGETEIVPTQLREVNELRIDSSKAREHLGWRPRWNLPDAIRATVAWYKERLPPVGVSP